MTLYGIVRSLLIGLRLDFDRRRVACGMCLDFELASKVDDLMI